MRLLSFLILLTFSSCQAKIRLLVDGKLERCDPKAPKTLIYECDLEFLVENDETFVNGNCTFNADVDVWLVSFWTEKKMGASWIRAPIQGSNLDVCKNIVEEKELLNPFLKAFQPCPFKKGVCFLFSRINCCITVEFISRTFYFLT